MRVPEDRFAPIRTPIGSAPEKATMQLLHHTCRSRMDRLNAAASVGGSSGKYGVQQRFSASTSRPMSSVRQNRYALMRASDSERTAGESEGQSPSDINGAHAS